MRRSIVISVVMVLCVLGLLLFGFGTETEVPAAPPGPVVLLVEDDTGAFLLQVKQGAQQAAAQAGCTLTQEPLSGKTLAEAAQRWSQRKATAALLLTEDAVLRAEAETALDAVACRWWCYGTRKRAQFMRPWMNVRRACCWQTLQKRTVVFILWAMRPSVWRAR